MRGPGAGAVIDGPFAETKEQLLGLYVMDCATEDAAIEARCRRGIQDPQCSSRARPAQRFSHRRPRNLGADEKNVPAREAQRGKSLPNVGGLQARLTAFGCAGLVLLLGAVAASGLFVFRRRS